jgi:PPP family 3-phenylpropionic acid transporter
MSTTRPKAVYFFYYAALACLAPFMTLYYAERGMSGAQIGVLAGMVPLISWFSAPLWGGIADATQRHRAVLLFNIAGFTGSAVVLLLADTFPELLLAVVTYAIFVGPIVPLVDNAVMAILGDRKNNYGRVRLWGSVGWGASSLFIGSLIDQSGLEVGFYFFMGIMVINLVVSAMLPMQIAGGTRPSYFAGLGVLLRNGRFLLLLLASLVFGVTLGVLMSYQFLYMEELGASRSLMSWTMTANTISEIPFWFISAGLLRRFGSSKMIALALAVTALRNFVMGAITDAWLVVPISLLHGPSFAVLTAAGVADADAAAPPGLGATAQGLFSGMIFGLGAALGGFLGGPAYEAIGFAAMYTLLGWLAFGMTVVFVAARLLPRRRAAVG